MTTEAQIEANRANAQKSTGPKTPEGKAAVAQNAVKHGLLARTAVLHGEDWEEYTCFREELLDELYADGAMEDDLADRIVSLSWRLSRAARNQNVIFEALYDKYVAEHGDEPLPTPDPAEGRPADGAPLLGRMMVADFAGDRVLERMLAYERRIEGSLYRTMAEFRRLQTERKAKGYTTRPSAAPSLPDDHPIWGRSPKRWTPPPPGPGTAGAAGCAPQPASMSGRNWSASGADRLQEILDQTALDTAAAGGRGVTNLPHGQGQMCQTNPIPGYAGRGGASGTWDEGQRRQTNPIWCGRRGRDAGGRQTPPGTTAPNKANFRRSEKKGKALTGKELW